MSKSMRTSSLSWFCRVCLHFFFVSMPILNTSPAIWFRASISTVFAITSVLCCNSIISSSRSHWSNLESATHPINALYFCPAFWMLQASLYVLYLHPFLFAVSELLFLFRYYEQNFPTSANAISPKSIADQAFSPITPSSVSTSSMNIVSHCSNAPLATTPCLSTTPSIHSPRTPLNNSCVSI